MVFILDDRKVNQSVFPEFEQVSGCSDAVTSMKPRKFNRSRISASTRAERYLRELRQEISQDQAICIKVAQIEKDVRSRNPYTPKAKPRKSGKSVHIAESTADIPGLVKQALGM